LNHERDERWAYVALAVLAVAYVVYRFSGSLDFGGISLRLPDLNFGKFGKSLPYLFAPLFAVLSEVFRRRKAKAARELWERRAREEGFLRGEENLKVRFVEGGRGSVKGDLRLTRAAFYIVDKSGRRDTMRFVLARAVDSEPAVLDVSLMEGSAPEFRRVRVTISRAATASGFALEFESREGEAWWSSLRRAMGKSTKAGPETELPTDPERA